MGDIIKWQLVLYLKKERGVCNGLSFLVAPLCHN
jgi:hypothetical protein